MKTPLSFSVTLPQVKEPTADYTKCPNDVARLCADMGTLAQEAFVVIDLNTRNRVIDKRLVTLGTVDASLVSPRETFRGAIANGAKAVILVHNHPSGDTSPSAEDLRVTRQLVSSGEILGIPVQDHIIIGGTSHISLRELGLVKFNA